MTTATIKKAQANIRRWRADPVAFVREEFAVEPEPWQQDFLNAYNGNPRTAAKACKGPGKTAVMAWCCWHFLATRPFPKIAATSISGDNLADGLWAEMAKWQHRSKFLTAAFTWQKTRIFAKDHAETWFMSARQWSKSAAKDQQANTLAGLHADYIMFVIDESGGVPDAVMAAAEAALATGVECKLLQCGNPTHLSGPLYRACTSERADWKVIEITGDPDDPKRAARISVEWARKQIRAYGRDNPWVLVNVFGKFPPSSLNGLIGPDDMAAAMRRVMPLDGYRWQPKVLGVDVARAGGDRSVIFPRQGRVMFKPKIMRIPDLVQVAGQVALAIQKFKPDMVNIDQTGGFGAAVVDNLRNWGYVVNGVEFAGSAMSRDYVNKRAEMAFTFAAWIKDGGCLPDLPELTEEATKLTYFFKGDQLQLIEKAQIQEELGRSPDLWDAGMLTHAYPVVHAAGSPLHAGMGAMADYNPITAATGGPRNGMDDYNPTV